jgi:hypothetical protein
MVSELGSMELLEFELPRHALLVFHPSELATEAVVVQRHEKFATSTERGSQPVDFLF